jgi:hypothetical protein
MQDSPGARPLALRISLITFVVVALIASIACSKHELRGRWGKSADGKTYLVVDDDNGGACGPIFVDDVEWPRPLETPRPIAPGPHVIRCGDGAAIHFEVPAGTTFYFNYWGP